MMIAIKRSTIIMAAVMARRDGALMPAFVGTLDRDDLHTWHRPLARIQADKQQNDHYMEKGTPHELDKSHVVQG